MDVVIYHNPKCGTSRNTLGLIRNAGIEPHIIDYLKCPPTRTMLKELIARAGLTVRAGAAREGDAISRTGARRSARSATTICSTP